MKIILENHNEQYAVREIVNSYFPKEKIEFAEAIPQSDDYVFSAYSVCENIHTYRSCCRINDKEFSSETSMNEFAKNGIKKTISDCLKNLTGITLPWGLLTGIRPSKIVREYTENTSPSSDAVEYLINKYETEKTKAKLAVEVHKNESEIINKMDPNGISLYIGIPFCPTRCLYCSFTSQSIAYSNKLTSPYVEALIKEIHEISKTEYVKKHTIETVYFGGGTPSALSAEQIETILQNLFEAFDLSHVKEITFEAGRPDTITYEKLEALKKFNITRISINPQTCKNETLKIIGRNHTNDDFLNAFKLARTLNFSHINCDVIAGLPGETSDDFKNTLKVLSQLSPESVTVHTMCIKHGSYLDMNYDMYTPTAAKTVNKMLDCAADFALKHKLIPYYMYRQKNILGNLENVGYCKTGHECLYNIYIMEEVQSIIALGGGGSSKIICNNNIERVFNVKEVSEYINRIDEMIERKKSFFKNYI